MSLPEKSEPVVAYDLCWIDVSLHEDTALQSVADYEKERRFPHCGAAIAWARRQLFHGKVFGSHIEMRKVVVESKADGTAREIVEEVVDITLPGFQRWLHSTDYGATKSGCALSAPERKCRTMR